MTVRSEPVLVTGATGFVGSHITRALAAAGHAVRCTVRPSSRLAWIEDLDVQRVPADLSDEASLRAAVEGIGAVVHAAGLTRAGDPAEYEAVNVGGTERLARLARAAGVRRFVLVSSLAARGPDHRDLPAGVDPVAGGDAPVSAYGRSKREAEKRLLGIAREPGGAFEPVILRPTGVYGPRDADLLPLFRMAARGFLVAPAGPGRLQPVYAEDVGRAVVIGAVGSAGPGPWDIAGTSVHDWSEVARELGAAVGRRVRVLRVPPRLLESAGAVAELAARLRGIRPVFDRRRATDLARHEWTCDVSVTERGLGWRADVSLADGLRRTAAWYRGAGWIPA
ncbi:MAG: NAD-dependent epimerase/dehydratase family protein [Gemmatimonadota bacterium]